MEQSTGQPSLDGRDNNNSSSTELNPAEIRKLEAESGKLEAETNLLLDELRRPWHRKRYFYQAITAGLVALPLVWFYYENFAFPLARAEFIEKEFRLARGMEKRCRRFLRACGATVRLLAANGGNAENLTSGALALGRGFRLDLGDQIGGEPPLGLNRKILPAGPRRVGQHLGRGVAQTTEILSRFDMKTTPQHPTS